MPHVKFNVLFSLSGYARLSNVEFYHSGQEGFVATYDARFSLTFFDIGRVSATRPSYVTHCTFHNGFSPAFGVVGTHDLEFVNNVIHHTVGSGMYDVMEEYTHKHACTHVLMYSCTQALMYSCTHALMHSCTHALMHSYSCTHVLMHSCTHALMYSCTHALMYSCTHALTHTHQILIT